MIELQKELSATTYPGRGIVLGKSEDGKKAVIAYFIMGRSENSRNRVFEETEDGIRTKAFDEGKMIDPSLIIYSPARVWRDQTIVTNGDQTDTIYEGFEQGLSFEQSLRSRTFEPDGPNYTPRISGLWKPKADSYHLSILKSADGNPDSVQRFFFDYSSSPAGRGHFIHTYAVTAILCPPLPGSRPALPSMGTLTLSPAWCGTASMRTIGFLFSPGLSTWARCRLRAVSSTGCLKKGPMDSRRFAGYRTRRHVGVKAARLLSAHGTNGRHGYGKRILTARACAAREWKG